MKVTATSTGTLLDAVDDLNRALTKGQKQAATDSAKVARKAILDTVKTRRHGRLSMSNMNLRALSLKPFTRATPTYASTLLRAVPAGPWAITEYGTRPHEIHVSRGKDGLFVNGAFFDKVDHPGARGFHVWDAVTREADLATGRTVTDAFDDAMAEAMK